MKLRNSGALSGKKILLTNRYVCRYGYTLLYLQSVILMYTLLLKTTFVEMSEFK